MANKVHFSSSNDRLVVEAGGVVELNGGEIQGNRPPRLLPPPVGTTDGYVLTAKGSAPGGADWEASGGGFAIGAVVEFFGWTFTPDGGGNAGGGLTFADPGNSAIYWSSGLTVADDNDGFVVTVAGRYRLTGTVFWEPSTGDTQVLTAGVAPSNGEGTPPVVVAATGSLSVKPSASVNVLTEINVGGRIRFSCAKLCASGPYVLYDSYFHVQYEGPAASL